jgi:membrane associated rhomboid family serine protease
VNIAAFFLEAAGALPFETLALWPPGGFESRFQPWQLVTYAFLHGSLGHLFFNMLALTMFGSAIERLFGARFYTQYYLACVVAAAASHLVVTSWMGGPALPTVGASGGVFGLLLAYGMFFPRHRVMLLFPPIPMQARTLVVVYALAELAFGVTQTAKGVAHFAHLGGMLGGWLMLTLRRRR